MTTQPTTFNPDALLDAWADDAGLKKGARPFGKSGSALVTYQDLLKLAATAHAAGRAECDETIAQRDQSIACLNLAVAIAKQVMREGGDEIARLKLAAAPKQEGGKS